MKYPLLLSFLILNSIAHAGLEPMTNEAMQATEGQGGADLSLIVSINHDVDVNGNSTNLLSSYCMTNYQLCRVGLSLNNRNEDGTVTGSATGKKIWLVYKGLQGTINIQKIALDATDLTYTNDTGASVTKAAIQLGFDPEKPILFRNVGYEALSVETDSVANEGANNIPGYLAITTGGATLKKTTNGKYDYSTAFSAGGYNYNSSSFDHGRQTGFTGLMMHGNLVLAGTMKIFSCDANHPRC